MLDQNDLKAIAEMFKAEMEPIKQDVAELKQKVTGIEVTLENETNKKINLMYESHQSMAQKLERVNEIDSMKEQLADIQRAVIVHTAQIGELKKA